MNKLSLEDTMEINMLFALTKCMAETAHNLQFVHKQKEKLRIKQVIKAISSYDKEINKELNKDQIAAVESIYDCIMDLLLDAKKSALDNYKKENT
jgi:hypothetical protein